MAAGLTAYAVVSPRTGEVRSAGVVTIPTVLGQTAEEVLFYPWSMYGTQPLRHLTDDELLNALGLHAFGITMEEVNQVLSQADGADAFWGIRFFDNFGLIMPLSLRWDGFVAALEWNLDEDGSMPAAGPQIFLKDFPALAELEEQVPVTLSFAAGGNSLSFLIRSAQTGTLTEEEQAAALERVENDLLGLFFPSAYAAELQPDDWLEGWPAGDDGADPPGLALRRIIQTFFDYNASFGVGSVETISDFLRDRTWVEEMGWLTPEDFDSASIDEFLSAVESVVDWSIQIVTTQQQIVVLFTRPGGAVFGVYYDIQLGCYSGIGVSQ